MINLDQRQPGLSTEPKRPAWGVRVWAVAAILAAAVVLVSGAYFLTQKFIRDRMAAMAPASGRRPPYKEKNRSEGRQQRTYTKTEIEKLRREGKLPAPVKQFYPPVPPAMPQDDAVQRSLRAIDEINRINQMNQRIMEQQQRMQKQK